MHYYDEHNLLRCAIVREHGQHVGEKIKPGSVQALGEDISYLLVSGDVIELQHFGLNKLSYEVKIWAVCSILE